MIINFKEGTIVRLLRTELLVGLLALIEISEKEAPGIPVVVTSVNDGVHKTGSLHGEGLAVDIRSRNFGKEAVVRIVTEFKVKHDDLFDLIWESPGTPNEHLHLEYDPGNRNH